MSAAKATTAIEKTSGKERVYLPLNRPAGGWPPGRTVIAIDPAPAMLAKASSRPGGWEVEWRLGTSDQITPSSTEVVVMSGNVARHIVGGAWHETLRDVAAGLRDGGSLVFESRNPLARAWLDWNDR